MKKLNRYVSLLILVNFLSGAAIMVIEMTGIRLLAPIFGSSIFSWTSLIGVVLIAISAGGLIGGFLADRPERTSRLAHVLMLSALFSIITPSLFNVFGGLTQSLGLISGPVVLSIVLFACPAFLLGMVGPLVTRSISRAHKDELVGFSAGLANMSGALGSFIGTFAAGFFLIPGLDTRMIFMLTACTLLVCALVSLKGSEKRMTHWRVFQYLSVFLALAMVLAFQGPGKSPGVLSVIESAYQRITVAYGIDSDGQLYKSLYNDRQLQGSMYEANGDSPHQYPRYWALAKQYKPAIEKAIVLGGGAYTIPKKIQDDYPKAAVTVVELDPVVTDIAREHFGINDYRNFDIVTDDARRYLSGSDDHYDFAFIDVFNGVVSIPSHLVTVEFFAELKERMTDDGVVMMNLIGSETDSQSSVAHAIHNSVKAVFDDVHLYVTVPEIANEASLTNIMIFASNDLEATDAMSRSSDDDITSLLDTYRPNYSQLDPVSGLVLTDFKNPIDGLFSSLLLNNL